MNYKLAGVLIGLAIIAGSGLVSYFVLSNFYRGGETITTSETLVLENYGNTLWWNESEYSVGGAEPNPEENTYDLTIYESGKGIDSTSANRVSVPASAYDEAQETPNPVTIFQETTSETKPLNVLPIATSVGLVAGLVAIAAWFGSKHLVSDTTSTLLEYGLEDMSLKDVGIVSHIIELKEFTIPQLVHQAKAPKLRTWRIVRKLIKRGLVQPTKHTIPSSNGLGGRGKPSRVYKYVEKKEFRKPGIP